VATRPAPPVLTREHLLTYVDLATTGRTDDAVDLCLDLLDAGVPAAAVAARLLRRAQVQLGRGWALGIRSVAEEHAATAVADACLAVLTSVAPPAPSGPAVLVACPEGEWHGFAARTVTALLRWRGVEAHDAGPILAPDGLDQLLRNRPAHTLALSCTTPAALPGVASAVGVAARRGVAVLGGGAGFGRRGRDAAAVGVTAWCHGPADAARRLARWAQQAPTQPPPPPEPIHYRRLARAEGAATDAIAHDLLAALADAGPDEAAVAEARTVVPDAARWATALALAASRARQPAVLHEGLAALAAAFDRRPHPLPAVAARLPVATVAALERHGCPLTPVPAPGPAGPPAAPLRHRVR
jgi:methanogenic corrinoid protein MtbC1